MSNNSNTSEDDENNSSDDEQSNIDQQDREIKKEIHRINNIQRQQEEYLFKISCEKPMNKKSVTKPSISDDKLTILFNEVEEQMDDLLEKAKKYVQFIFKQQDDISNEIPNTYLKVQPSLLKKGKLTDYQLQGLNWLISLQESGLNGILADQMGLGKTIQTIALLAFMKQFKNIGGPHLIIGPLSTLGNWVRELSEWLPSLKTIQMLATEEWRHLYGKKMSSIKFDIIVASYESVINNVSVLNKYYYQYIVIDEAHKLKNEESVFQNHLKRLQSKHKLLLTGTPIQNNPHELWSLLHYLMPQLFSSSEVFDKWFDINKLVSQQQAWEHQDKNLQLIQKTKAIIKSFMLRRTKNEVALEIPPKKELNIYVQLTPLQKKHYRDIILNKKITTTSQSQKSIYNILMQLRKICLHLYMFRELEDPSLPPLGEHLIETSGKLKFLDMLLKKLIQDQQKHQVILFSQFTSLLDILEDYLTYRNYKYCRLDGSTSIEIREQNIKDFQKKDSDIFVFLLSTRAGGLGITLTAADTVIIYDSDFNPQFDLQAMDRAHRIGQSKHVVVYRLICKSTVEEKIIERQQIKLRWEQMMIDKGCQQILKFKEQKNDVQQIITFGATQILKDEPYTEEDIETLIKRGEELTEKLKQDIDFKLQTIKNDTNEMDLGLQSIKVRDFFKDPNNQKELQVIEQAIKLQQIQEKQSSKKLPLLSSLQQIVQIPIYQFHSDPEQLQQLKQRQLDAELNQYCIDNNKEIIQDIEIIPLTKMEENQLQKLEKSGFDWTEKEYNSFLQACYKYGRQDIENLSKATGKSNEEIKNYIKVFNKYQKRLPDYEKIIGRIKKIEDQFEEEKEIRNQIKIYIDQFENPLLQMELKLKYQNTPYNQEYDQLFIYATYLNGYGNWEQIYQFIYQHKLSMFDDYLKSISIKTMKLRINIIVKQIKKLNIEKEKHIREEKNKNNQKIQQQQDSKKQINEEEKEQEIKKQSKPRTTSRKKQKSKSSSRIKSVKRSQKKEKQKPISNVKSQTLDKKFGKQVMQE